jgi:hypothetical protein
MTRRHYAKSSGFRSFQYASGTAAMLRHPDLCAGIDPRNLSFAEGMSLEFCHRAGDPGGVCDGEYGLVRTTAIGVLHGEIRDESWVAASFA